VTVKRSISFADVKDDWVLIGKGEKGSKRQYWNTKWNLSLLWNNFYFFNGKIKYELTKGTVFSSNLKQGKEGMLQTTKGINCTPQLFLTSWYVSEKENVHFRSWWFIVSDSSKQTSLSSNWIFVCEVFIKTSVQGRRWPDPEAMQGDEMSGSISSPRYPKQGSYTVLHSAKTVTTCSAGYPPLALVFLHSIHSLNNGHYPSSPVSSTKPLLKHKQLNPTAILCYFTSWEYSPKPINTTTNSNIPVLGRSYPPSSNSTNSLLWRCWELPECLHL